MEIQNYPSITPCHYLVGGVYMDQINWMQLLIDSGLLFAVLGVLIALLGYAKKYIELKTEELLINIENDAIKEAIMTAEDAIMTTVMQLSQEMVDELKAAAVDGKLTPEEVRVLRDLAYKRAIKLMGKETYDLVASYVEDVGTWFNAKIDAAARIANH